MIKFISVEQYNELKSDVDRWKRLAKEEVKERVKKVHEYNALKEKYDELKEQKQEKATFISLGEVKSLSKAQKIAEEVRKLINNEHCCNKKCFAEHVLPAIQNDYDKINHSSNLISHKFIEHWSDKLCYEYNFINCICVVNGKITVKFN